MQTRNWSLLLCVNFAQAEDGKYQQIKINRVYIISWYYYALDRILYFIVGGMFGGMLLIVIPIALLAPFCYMESSATVKGRK